MRRRSAVIALALVAAPLAFLPVTRVAASDDPSVVALHHLRADAGGALSLRHGADGRLDFVGTGAHTVVDNPSVDGGDSVRASARAHLDRYGAALGAARGTTYVQRSATHTVAGTDVVRYDQQVDGVPVLGGQVVLGLGAQRDLRSLAADVTPMAIVNDATVAPSAAAQTARGLVLRSHPGTDPTVTDGGRFVLDPSVAGLTLPGGTRTVRRLQVSDGPGVRDLVLVDDHTGHVVFRTSLIENLDRVVCDRANLPGAETPCTSGFARVEGGGTSAIVDVNDAFDYAQEVSDFYSQIGGLDLTQLLGVDESGTKKLAATVRYCTTDLTDACPYDNAFWDGTQMYYGNGYASADDVVGHEMTHGVIDQFSQLFYWGQSGAINESLADTMGEFIDHRNGADDDSAWNLGEDLPGGALRNMKDPTIDGQPDRTSSPNYVSGLADSGGVHTNSGVATKTAYLISQGTGGTAFNGRTFPGIDTDSGLTKTSKLYLDVIESLPSGAGFATLAAQLDQSCADLLGAGTSGFTAADCASVHQATLATELTTAPVNAAPPADASTACPAGTLKRALYDSETGDPTTKFNTPTGGWERSQSAGVPNATSGLDSWYAADPGTGTVDPASIQTNVLRGVSVALPAGQQSFLSFQNWYVLDYDQAGYYDGGTVETVVDGGPATAPAAGLWINGPDKTLATGFGNSGAGQLAFSGDSNGWSTSRLDLTSDAGHLVRPQFTMRSDNYAGFVGWYLDDIRIYTCDRLPGAPSTLISMASCCGGPTKPIAQAFMWGAPAVNAAGVLGYRVYVDGVLTRTPGPSTRTIIIYGLAANRRHTVSVRAVGTGGYLGPARSVTTVPSTLSITLTRKGAQVTISGVLRRNGVPYPGRRVWVERKVGSSWAYVSTPPMVHGARGVYSLTVTHAGASTYRVMFPGGTNVTGTYSVLRRK